ncbi:MAG: hypothetical protein EOO93_02500 [Pedobacter sp.]|nr:MAG: hypothetical protein EOO93_02500 [Pedobacter sp.]
MLLTISSIFPLTEIYDDDFLGCVADIKVAAALLDSPITFSFEGEHVIIGFKGNSVGFSMNTLSLNAFKLAFKLNVKRLKTKKSKGTNFIEDHLKNAFES